MKTNPFLLPDRQTMDQVELHYGPENFQEWLDQLPMADPEKAAKLLYRQIKRMNGVELPVSDRLANLEATLTPLYFLLDALGGWTLEESHPLGARAKKTVQLSGGLLLLMAKAYKVVMDQYHHESIAGHLIHKKNRILALHRIVYSLGRVLLHTYAHYQPLPEYLWKELHGIYLYAEEHHLSDRKLEIDAPYLTGASSVQDVYKQILLLALSGPYRLLPGEAKRVYLALSQWVRHCEIVPLGQERSNDILFIVNVSHDSSPRCRDETLDQSISKGWLIDTARLTQVITIELEKARIELGALRPAENDSRFNAELLSKLILAWGVGLKRSVDREKDAGEVVLINGMDQLYQSVGGAPVPRRKEQFVVDDEYDQLSRDFASSSAASQMDGMESLSMLPGTDQQVVNRLGKAVMDDGVDSTVIVLEGDQVEVRESIEGGSKSHRVIPNFVVLDQSEKGYHLGAIHSQSESVRVGELVAICSGRSGERWQYGVIRWLKSEKPNLLDLGVELFDGELKPVVFGRHCLKGIRDYYEGLLVSKENERYLITEPFYSEGFDDGVLLTENNEIDIQLSRVIEATGSFLKFQITEYRQQVEGGSQEGPLYDDWDSLEIP